MTDANPAPIVWCTCTPDCPFPATICHDGPCVPEAAPRFYVLGHDGTHGPFDAQEAGRAQDRMNSLLGVDQDGEGFCDAIVVTESQARALGAI